MAPTRNKAKAGITKTWALQDGLPNIKRRTQPVQEAYDFFLKLPVGKSAIIPFAEQSTARTAARDLLGDEPGFRINFRREPNNGFRAWKTVVTPDVVATE